MTTVTTPRAVGVGQRAAARTVDAVKIYGTGQVEVRALDAVTVDFFAGRYTAIMGPSGSGKSTLLHCAAGLDTLTSGKAYIGDADLSTLNDHRLTILRRDHVGFVFQAFNLVPTITAAENITLPLLLAGRKGDKDWIAKVIETLDIGNRLSHRPQELSGGQQQRVAVARALASRPEIIFADEPTGNLDSRAGAEVLTFMRRAVDDMGQTIVMVTHDPIAASYADRIVFLADGRIVDEMGEPTAERVLERMKRFGEWAGMFRVIAHGLLARKFRLFATALAVTLGVAFMAGTLVLTDTIGNTFNSLSTGVYKGTDAEVRAKVAFTAPAMGGGDQRPLISASLVPALRRVSDVAADEGSAYGYARLTGSNGKALGNPAAGAPTLGGNWNQVSQLNPWTLVAGHPPQAADQVVIDKKSAIDGHLRVGDMTTVLALGPPQRFKVVGIVTFGTADSPGGASVALFTTPVAQRLVAAPGKLTSVLFVAKPGVSQQQLAASLGRALPHGLEAVTGATVTKEMQTSFQQAMAFFNTFMMIFAVIALLVGAFMIFNTFSITVAQRTRENGLMRALGATKRQVLGSVLAEAAAVGVIASAVGLAAGVAVAAGLEALLNALGFGLPAGGIVFSIRTVIVAGLAGLVVTVVAALSPARKAAKVPPIAAMQAVSAGSTGYGSKQRIMVGTAILVLGMAALFTGLFGHIASAITVVGLGVLLVFFGVSVLGRTVSLPLSRVVGAPLPRLRGIAGKLARENAMRDPKRTASSASALMIGVGLVSFITILAASTTASVNSTIDRSFAGDIVIDSGAGLTGGIDPELAQRLNTLPQVSAATGVGTGIAEVFGKVEQMSAVDPRTGGKIFHVSPVAGSIGALGPGDIAVYKDVATSHHLRIGSTVPVLFRDAGRRTLRVGLIYGDSTAAPAPRYFLGTPAYNAYFALHYDSSVVVQKAPGVSTAAALAAVRAVATRYSGTSVMDQAAFKAERVKPYNQMLMLVYALLALAILIALLGIGNTLALSIFERTRELGVMRAVGMTRRQLRATIRWESAIIALQGTFLGLLVGLFFGWALVRAMHSQGVTVFSLPVLSLVIMVVLAGLAGLAAAILPSRRAAKLNILRAITSE